MGIGGALGAFVSGAASGVEKRRERQLEKERLAQQGAQFQQQLALQREQLNATNARNDLLDKFMMKRADREDTRLESADARANAAAAREQEQHDLTVGIWRDPARRDAMVASKMAELKQPLLQLQQLEFQTGKMPERYDRELALGKLEETAKGNQNALTAAQTKAAEQNYSITEAMRPIQEQTAKLGLDYQKWKMRPGALEAEDALQQANIFATKIGTMQTIQGMMLANAREGRESLKLSRDELSNLSEMIISTAGVMPGNTPDEKMQAAQNYWTKAWGVASDMMDPKMIDAIGGTMAAGPDYQRFKQDTALVGTGITNGRQATPEELASAMKRTEAFAAKLATADEGLRATSRAARTPPPSGPPAAPRNYAEWKARNPGKANDSAKAVEVQEADVGRRILSVPGVREIATRAFTNAHDGNPARSDAQLHEWIAIELNARKDLTGDPATRAIKMFQKYTWTKDTGIEPGKSSTAEPQSGGRTPGPSSAVPFGGGRGGYDRNGNWRNEGEDWQYPGET